LVGYQKNMQMCMFSHYIQQCASGKSEYRFGLSFFEKKEYRFGLQRQSHSMRQGDGLLPLVRKMYSVHSGKVPEFRWSNCLLEKFQLTR
jgi:hypothetical protein